MDMNDILHEEQVAMMRHRAMIVGPLSDRQDCVLLELADVLADTPYLHRPWPTLASVRTRQAARADASGALQDSAANTQWIDEGGSPTGICALPPA